ncbi:DUF1799 domain-containing protein [Halodurantibacterium flavum]|uniref:DUF1799 domain-containing protein n=1 Tax=Halodurantibacterium flavum TaxID=1382802 RepID=A0ABW4SAP1_9RHOB
MIHAGRLWARGDLGRDDERPGEAERDALRWGLPRIPGRRRPPEPDGLWPDHVDAALAFLAISGQWRGLALADGSVRWIGLDYTAAQAGLALAGLTVTPELWSEIRLIEAGAVEELNRRG